MTVTDKCVRVLISEIIVDRETRQRRKIETGDLEKSISRIGLINPITIDKEMRLRAGERRLTACRNLGHVDILARFVEDLSPIEGQILELEENLKRENLEWKDQVDAVARIHRLYQGLDADWTMTETAEALSMTQGTISMYIRVDKEIGGNLRVAQAGTIREAHNVIMRGESRAMGNALEELLEIMGEGGNSLGDKQDKHPEAILNESFLTWGPSYQGKKFNLIHCDFPYGVGFASGIQGQGVEPGEIYNDSVDIYWGLLEALCKNIDRLMSVSGHLMFWLSADHDIHAKTRVMFAQLAPSLEIHKWPLIWLKSDNAGIAGDSRRHPRHVYETCLLASRGKRQVVRIMADAYSAPTDKRLHISTKPEPMLRHFMTMLVDGGTSLLDPTCGSGAALRAAESLGASHVLGLEIDSGCCDRARQALHIERLKRAASKTCS